MRFDLFGFQMLENFLYYVTSITISVNFYDVIIDIHFPQRKVLNYVLKPCWIFCLDDSRQISIYQIALSNQYKSCDLFHVVSKRFVSHTRMQQFSKLRIYFNIKMYIWNVGIAYVNKLRLGMFALHDGFNK